MPDHTAAKERVALETAFACVEVFNNWKAVAVRKKPEDLLGNSIHHPNDFGHWISHSLCEFGL
jgi:hypothetical protein